MHDFPVRDEDGDPIFENMMAELLLSSWVIVNNHWWKRKDGWNPEQCDTMSFSIITNDIFIPGADAYEFTFSQILEVYLAWESNGYDGLIEWVKNDRKRFE